MKILHSTIHWRAIAAFIALFAIGHFTYGQSQATSENFRVVKGERPPINVSSVSADAYEAGMIKIKFMPEYAEHLASNPATLLENGLVSFNLPMVDELNQVYGAREAQQLFASDAFERGFTERHKAWGFHLWYTLWFDATTDVKEMIQLYGALAEIEIAEPEYKKQLIVDPGMEWIFGEVPEEKIINADWTPNDPQFSSQWHYHNTGQANGTPGADISLTDAWDIETGNSDVVVAIVDDGIQFTHSDIAANMWSGTGFNFVNNSPNINPGNHGTHVAGTVAALNNNGVGVSGVAGGSGSGDGVRLMSCQVFSGSSSGGFHLAPVWAADNGAAISQNSWGYTSSGVYDQNVLDAIDYFNLNGGGNAMTGGITIFAAGNSNASGAWYPGYYSGAFAVASTNNQDVRASYSNYGTWIDISAPGGQTSPSTSGGVLSTITGGSYAYYQGTSMACPHASGVAALILSLAYGELTNSDIADILRNTTDDHYAVNPNYIGQLGTGRLNAYQALLETQNYLTGVMNPANFVANTAGTSEINLEWNKNTNNDDVLLAWSANSTFGQPEPTISYQPGAQLPGGGTVLYAGDGTAFTHTGLQAATTYHYKVWSYDAALAYSSGRTTSGSTACDVLGLPFAENFDAAGQLPLCWTSEVVSGSTNWVIGSGNGGSNPSSAYSPPFNAYFKQTGSSGHTGRLITPDFNIPNAQTVELTFHYTNQRRTFLWWTYQDVLVVKYNTYQNPAWQTLATYNSNVANWTQVTLSLPDPQNIRQIAFEAQSNRGHGVCIDNLTITSSDIMLSIKALLEGPFNGVDAMHTSLNADNMIPLSQPYGAEPWLYTGTEAVTSIPNNDVVDWILVEMRETTGDASTATPDKIIARQAAFLLKDGTIAGLDGLPHLVFNNPVNHNLYVVLWHRNHLGIMSAGPVQLAGGVYSYDYSTGHDKVHGGTIGYRQLTPTMWGMVSGDGDANGQVNNADKLDVWQLESGSSGYLSGDFNQDSQVNNGDKIDNWMPNSGKACMVPN